MFSSPLLHADCEDVCLVVRDVDELSDASTGSGGLSSSSRSSFKPSGFGDVNDLVGVAFELEPCMMDVLADLFSKDHGAVCWPGCLAVMQPEINKEIRGVLVMWLVEVHQQMKLEQSSLFLGASILDRYLSKCSVKRAEAYLVGVACLLLAASFQECHTNTPTPDHFVYYTEGACAKEDIVKMECRILAALGFDLMVPTCHQFLEVFELVNGGDAEQLELGRYILKLSLLDSSLTRFEPSYIAAGASLVANELAGRATSWPTEMASVTRCSALRLAEVTNSLRSLFISAHTLTRDSFTNAMVNKYSKEKRRGVAKGFPNSAPLPGHPPIDAHATYANEVSNVAALEHALRVV